MVGNDTPVFFIRVPTKFPDFIHSRAPISIAVISLMRSVPAAFRAGRLKKLTGPRDHVAIGHLRQVVNRSPRWPRLSPL